MHKQDRFHSQVHGSRHGPVRPRQVVKPAVSLNPEWGGGTHTVRAGLRVIPDDEVHSDGAGPDCPGDGAHTKLLPHEPLVDRTVSHSSLCRSTVRVLDDAGKSWWIFPPGIPVRKQDIRTRLI